jgi:predicted amidohydrolase YtcJ
MPLDTLVIGRVATFAGEAGFGWVEAIGIKDGKVAFAGSAVDLETRADPHTQRFNLERDEIAIPGLTDAHLHLRDAALEARQVNLAGTASLDEGLALIEAAASRLGPDEWLLGAGWDHGRWGRWPTADDLEGAVRGRPAALRSIDHHAIWASHSALRAASIDAALADPPGGIIRRSADGEPNGVLLENASELVSRLVPEPSDDVVKQAIAELAEELLRYGIVGIHDPGALRADPTLQDLELLGSLSDRGDLPLQVLAGIRANGLPRARAEGLGSGTPIGRDPAGTIRLGWLKLFADGTLGSQTAALVAPREDSADRGVMLMRQAELAELAFEAAAGGIATQIHAIGDAAVGAALDALAPTTARVSFMPRLEHVQLCLPEDRARFGALGIGASVQPVHLREDAATARRDWGSRAETSGYAWRSLLEAGAVLAFGTDAPIEPVDPWPGIALAVLRRDPSWGDDAEPFGPDEALTLDQALRAATVGPAQLARDPLGGRLIPGAPGDLIVLPAAPREPGERAAAFAAVRPRLVLVGGEALVEL